MKILAKNRFTGEENFELGMVMDLPGEDTTNKVTPVQEEKELDFSKVKAFARVIRVSASQYKVVPLKKNSQKMVAKQIVASNVEVSYSEDLEDDNELVNKSENALWNISSKNGELFIQRI